MGDPLLGLLDLADLTENAYREKLDCHHYLDCHRCDNDMNTRH